MSKEEITHIIDSAIDIERWVEKSNHTYSFIDDEERKEITENILKELNKKGYKIVLKRDESSRH
tara:strand:+ start:245 stop:436 length:192 start_codon:yes stop_codon:yes gene_type:complete